MKQNLGTYDRLFRMFLGIGLLAYGLYVKSGFTVLGGLFSIYEAIASWCVLYQIIGRNTCPLPNSKAQQIEVIPVYIQGLAILLVAIGLNFFAFLMKWETWYGFLQNPQTLSLDNYLFLFIAYPFMLGLTGKYSGLVLSFFKRLLN